MAFVSFETIRGMSPRSISGSYLSAIRNFFTMNCIHNNFKSSIHSDLVTFVRRGYEKIYHQIHPISGAKKMAFTLDLVNYVVEAMKDIDKRGTNSWSIRPVKLP